jgi:NAD(P)-dependent dehydrogenase (short-subunit alcohol dehydrogenase family)
MSASATSTRPPRRRSPTASTRPATARPSRSDGRHKREDNANAVAATVDAFGDINVGLFNAGLNKPRFFMDIDEDNWDMIMNVNTKAMWLGMQETARQMIAQGPQDKPYKLINVGSIASRKPLVDVTVYCTSKYGCLALTECGALGLAEHNITVNGYAPGVVVTPLWEQLDKDLVEIGFKERRARPMTTSSNATWSSSACPIPRTSPARPRSSRRTTATT